MESEEAFKELQLSAVEGLVICGMMDAVSESWPDEVQERWTEKILYHRNLLEEMKQEFLEFAQFYDE